MMNLRIQDKKPKEVSGEELEDFKQKKQAQKLFLQHKAFNEASFVSKLILGFVFGWMAAVISILCWQGHIGPEKRLSESILIALLTTATINVLSLLFIVIKHIFNHRLKMDY